MSISQRKDGRFVVKYKVANEWKQKSFRTRDDAEAFDKENQYDKDAETSTRLTIAESILAFLKNAKICDNRQKAYTRAVEYLGDSFCDQYVDALTRRDLETARDILRDRKISNIAINRYTGYLITAWRWCFSEDLLKVIPWEKYRKLPEEPHKHWCGKQEDFEAAYAASPEYLKWFIRTALALCCRPGKEVTELRWKDVHLDEGFANIWMYKVSARKTVWLPQWWIEEARTRKGEDTERVCPGKHGGWTPHLIWAKACARAGVKNCPLYTVRHFAASKMIEAGADIAAVAAQLGHRDITTTGQFYAHAAQGAQMRAAAMLPAPKPLVQDGADEKDK